MSTSLQDILNEIKVLDKEYFDIFMKEYPLLISKEKEQIFGSAELIEKAIEIQVLVTLLGETALKRMNYLGFNYIYPFDNPVDWYNWKENIINNKVSHTIYLSMSLRMVSEIKRMESYLERDNWDAYNQLSESEFLTSKNRYKQHFEQSIASVKSPSDTNETNNLKEQKININNFHYNQKVEDKAVGNLDRIQKHSSIWSNIINVASKIIGIKI